MKRPSIAILIPCYNEEQTIEKVINDFHRALPDATIYIYDNNSTDKTAIKAKKAGAIVVPEYRQGKGNVIRSMFRDIEADCYLMVDGDDTYDAKYAEKLCNLVLSGKADMAIGDRLSSTYRAENKRRFHNLGNVSVRAAINLIFHSDIKDVMTGYRAFSRIFVKSFPVLSKGFEIETEMTIFAIDHNFKLAEIPIGYRDRPVGSTSKLNTYKDGARVIHTIAMLFKEYRPTLFFNCLAVLFLLFSLILGIPVLTDFIRTGLVPRFPSLIVSAILIVLALLLFITGTILTVIVKKHRQLFELYLNHIKSTLK